MWFFKKKKEQEVQLFSEDFQKNFLSYYDRFFEKEKDVIPIKRPGGFLVYKYAHAKSILEDNVRISYVDHSIEEMSFLQGSFFWVLNDKHLSNKKILLKNLISSHKKGDHFLMESQEYFQLLFDQMVDNGKGNIIDELINPFVLKIILKEFGIINVYTDNASAEMIDFVMFTKYTFENWFFLNDTFEHNLKEESLSAHIIKLLTLLKENDSKLNDKELLNYLTFSGTKTTSSLISYSLLHILKNKEIIASIYEADESLDLFIDEILRFYSPVQFTYRKTTTDFAIGNNILPSNSLIAVSLGAANRDPDRFTNAKDFGFKEKKSISFGKGAYKCIGEHLAKDITRKFLLNIKPFLHKMDIIEKNRLTERLELGNTIRSLHNFKIDIRPKIK